MSDYKELIEELKAQAVSPLSAQRSAADALERLTAERDELVATLEEAIGGTGGSYAIWSPKARAIIARVKGK